MHEYELKLATGQTVVWEGRTPEEAMRGYVSSHPDQAVIAWRHYPRHGVFAADYRRIIEPGDRGWGRQPDAKRRAPTGEV